MIGICSRDYQTKLREKREEGKLAASVRANLFRTFWSKLIERAKDKTGILEGRSTSAVYWIAGTSGRKGFQFNFALTKDVSRVELYIDHAKGTDEETLAAFQALEAQKVEIEQRFGNELQWQQLPDRRACRVCFECPGGWRTPEEGWPELQNRMVNSMVKLENAIRPALENVP